MPVSETKQPKDAVALHERIRGPSKEEIEAAVAESLGAAGKAEYVETDIEKTVAIAAPCLVFLIFGKFKAGEQVCEKRYLAYHITNEDAIQMEAYSVVVIIQGI